jgi:hypothetical protein
MGSKKNKIYLKIRKTRKKGVRAENTSAFRGVILEGGTGENILTPSTRWVYVNFAYVISGQCSGQKSSGKSKEQKVVKNHT